MKRIYRLFFTAAALLAIAPLANAQYGEYSINGQIKDTDPASEKAQKLVKKLQSYMTEHFYTCTDEILSGLGKMYAGGGDFTTNIDSYGGEGTAEFAHRAIEVHCR